MFTYSRMKSYNMTGDFVSASSVILANWKHWCRFVSGARISDLHQMNVHVSPRMALCPPVPHIQDLALGFTIRTWVPSWHIDVAQGVPEPWVNSQDLIQTLSHIDLVSGVINNLWIPAPWTALITTLIKQSVTLSFTEFRLANRKFIPLNRLAYSHF